MTCFYLHCVIAIVVLIADARGTLEPSIQKWEKKLGIPIIHNTSNDSMEVEISEPYPIQDEPEQDTFNNRR